MTTEKKESIKVRDAYELKVREASDICNLEINEARLVWLGVKRNARRKRDEAILKARSDFLKEETSGN